MKTLTTLLAIDVGNSFTRFGLFADAPEPTAIWSVATHHIATADEAYDAILRHMELAGIDGRPQDAVISCVVPSLTDVWSTAAERVCDARPLTIGPGLKTGVQMHYNDPGEVGADRVADIVAAKAAYGAPLVAVDLGTTTNIEVLDKSGAFVGGLIAPGLAVGARAISQTAARLSTVELRAPQHIIGKNTREAMQAGIVMGEVARIDGLIQMVWRELGYETHIVASGSYASELAALSSHQMTADDTLTLRGLALLYGLNRKRT
jgi:type III pantothenate kinase